MAWSSLGRTLLWIGITVPLQLALGLATALLLNQRFAWRGLARSLILIPWALPSVVIALMWSWMYQPQVGLFNDLLLRVGLVSEAVPWLAQPATALYAIILALVWQGFPFFAIMILAGLQAIPAALYEAAAIDGATPWQQFREVTLPGLKGVLVTAVMLRLIWVANSIDVIVVMTGGGPGYATHTLPLYAGFKRTYGSMDFGYGTALAVTFSVLLLSLIVLYLRRVGKSLAMNIAGPRPTVLRRALTLHLPMAAIVLFAIGPYLWMLLTSIRPNRHCSRLSAHCCPKR